jgi:hypothetical protein
LLPALQIETVLEEPTISKRRKALWEIHRGLDGAFAATIKRIQDQKPSTSKYAMDALQWMFLAKRQLSIEELRHALAVEPGDSDLDWENFPEVSFLLDSCLGLVVLDESTSTARLVHKSLQDYLQIQYNQYRLFEKGHYEIAQTCLSYLSFEKHDLEFGELRTGFVMKYVLIDYAGNQWGHHARNAKMGTIQSRTL